MNKAQLKEDIRHAINRNSAENGSDTPDFILAEYLMDCLDAFDKTVQMRSGWYNHHCHIGGCNHLDAKMVSVEIPSTLPSLDDLDYEVATEKPEVITDECLICGAPRDGIDKFWCSACLADLCSPPVNKEAK